MKVLAPACVAVLVLAASESSAQIVIESLSGAVTSAEVSSYKTFMQSRTMASSNLGNAWVYGSSGTDIESLGMMYEVTGDRAILDRMIQYADKALNARNHPTTGRIIWTGRREGGHMPITVSILEDDDDASAALVQLIGGEPKLQVVRRYRSGEDALAGVPAETPDVLLVDINLPGMSGIQCVAALKARLPGLRVLMLSTYEEADLIFDSLRAGASGYLLKKRVPDELVSAIEQVFEGGAPMSMQIARKVVDYFQKPAVSAAIEKLTPREDEILGLLATGSFDKEIADTLSISINTVRAHLRNIYEKLHVQSRTEAVVKFLESRRPR